MPNGGSDCCGTCWFNRANGGRKGSGNHDRSIASHCEIRDLPIRDPFYTYCANHPYRPDQREPIPIGPVFVATGAESNSFCPASLDGSERSVSQRPPPVSLQSFGNANSLLDGWRQDHAFGTVPFFFPWQRESMHE